MKINQKLTVIDQATITSYLEANYYVKDTVRGEIYSLKVGESNDDINEIIRRHNAKSGLIITAWNPHSVKQPMIRNRALNLRLSQHPLVANSTIKRYQAYGNDEAESWHEKGVFLTNVNCKMAKQLCVLFKQNAAVNIHLDHPAKLLWHPNAILRSSA